MNPNSINAAEGASLSNAELERVIERCKARMDYEAKAAAHHCGTWHEAYEYHLTRFAAMSDLMDVMRSNFEANRAGHTDE